MNNIYFTINLQSRYGTVNKERMEVLDYCYKQIAE